MRSLLLIVVMMTFAGAVSGQIANVMLDESPAVAHSPVVAISGRNAETAVVSDGINIYTSRDGGKTWEKKPVSLPGGPTVLLGESKGDFFCFASRPGAPEGENGSVAGVLLQKSTDGGTTWSQGESISITGTHDAQRYWAAMDHRGNFYLTWTVVGDAREGNQCPSAVFFSTSKNGKKWTDPLVLTQVDGDCQQVASAPVGAMPAIAPDGKAFASWSHGGKVYLDRSFDGGTLWLSNDIAVAEQPGGNALLIEGHGVFNAQPVLVADNSKGPWRGSLYLVWADQRNGENDTDIWFTRSHNFGDNWSLPVRINDDAPGKHQYMPWITIDATTGHIYIVYFDRRNTENTDTEVWLAWSDNGGNSFKNMRISEKAFASDEAHNASQHINVAARDGVIVPVWTATQNGKTQLWTAVLRPADLKQP